MVVQKLRISGVRSLYQCDLAYVHATAFEDLARGAAHEIVGRLRASKARVRTVMDVGCGAGPLTRALIEGAFDVTGVDTSAELIDLARANVREAHSFIPPYMTPTFVATMQLLPLVNL